jgi:hypothetical protein
MEQLCSFLCHVNVNMVRDKSYDVWQNVGSVIRPMIVSLPCWRWRGSERNTVVPWGWNCFAETCRSHRKRKIKKYKIWCILLVNLYTSTFYLFLVIIIVACGGELTVCITKACSTIWTLCALKNQRVTKGNCLQMPAIDITFMYIEITFYYCFICCIVNIDLRLILYF